MALFLVQYMPKIESYLTSLVVCLGIIIHRTGNRLLD